MQVYYVRLFDPYKPDQSVYQKEIQVSANIATTLLVWVQWRIISKSLYDTHI